MGVSGSVSGSKSELGALDLVCSSSSITLKMSWEVKDGIDVRESWSEPSKYRFSSVKVGGLSQLVVLKEALKRTIGSIS